MFRRAASTEEPRFLKDLLEALRDSEEELAEAEAAAEADLSLSISDLTSVTAEAAPQYDRVEIDSIWAEIALLRELSAEWKEAVRLDREQTSYLSEIALAA